MLSGLPPERHQVLWNYYDPSKKVRIPTIFTPCRSHGLRCAIFAGKEKFLHFAELEPGVQHYDYQLGAERVVAEAIRFIREKQPDLVFIHVAEVDAAGHAHGWNSPEQRAAIEAIDARLGQLVAALDNASKPAALIITSDHGGHGFTHGNDSSEDRQIPWIARGDGLQALGVTAHTRAVSTMDTAATVLTLLELPVPTELVGRPVAVEAALQNGERLKP
jgi:bisphosphoglycerate-independent phosphoglycerate mutase (AlkP superfamily)